MQKVIRQRINMIPLLTVILFSFLFYTEKAFPVTTNNPDFLPGQREKLLNGEVLVVLTNLQDNVTGVEGQIYIAAPPKKVWETITNYDNHKNFVPKVTDSGIISDNGTEKVVFEKGKSGIFIFRKNVYVKLKVWGENPKRLFFQQITGDFKVYHGEWILVDYPQGPGTFLTYKAEVKPDFYAPRFAVKNVQQHECPLMMSAMKKQAEASFASEKKSEL